MNAEILTVGTELLLGKTANTNAQYLSSRLAECGIEVVCHTAVGDDTGRLKEALALALSRSDVVVLTGGLGPTLDDLTKETVASHLGRKLILHEESLAEIKEYFNRMHRSMVMSNQKQAYMPEGCLILKNSRGTAPGCILEEKEKVVVLLPGPPEEMIPMFEEAVLPYLRDKSQDIVFSKDLKIFGLGEALVEEKLSDLIAAQKNPALATYAQMGEVTLRLTAICRRHEDSQMFLSPSVEKILERLGPHVYSTGGETLEEVVGHLLMKKGTTLSIAESCTGGMLSERLTGVPGISAIFHLGVVAYGNEAKKELLGVRAETLENFGAVSSRTAVEMARGIREKARSDVGVSITGIAGPGGGTPEKPVGLVFIGIADAAGTFSKELHLQGDRERIRHLSCLHALDALRRRITGIQV